MLGLSTWEQVSSETRRLIGKGISKQAFAILPEIADVHYWLTETSLQVIEVHPEVSFALMLGAPATEPKKTRTGREERRSALERKGISLDHVVRDRSIRVNFDDVLDAGAAAWTGKRFVAGFARSFPDRPPIDASGRPVAIWA